MLILRSSQNPMTPDLHQELGLLNSSLQGIPSESTGRLIVEEKLKLTIKVLEFFLLIREPLSDIVYVTGLLSESTGRLIEEELS